MNLKLAKQKIKLLGLLLPLALFSFNGHAIGFHLEGFAAAGYGKIELDKETESPNMGSFSLGGTAGLKFIPLIYLGASIHYQNFGQFSDTNKAYGNRKGNRFSVNPTLGVNFLMFHFKYEYIMMGDYTLSKKTSDSKEVSYLDPTGHRLTAQVSVFPFIKAGAFFETIEFEKLKTGSTESTPTNKYSINHYGLVVSFIL